MGDENGDLREEGKRIVVRGFVGLPGSGKTYMLCKRAYEDWVYGKKQVDIYANFNFGVPGTKRVETWKDLMDVSRIAAAGKRKSLILIDEINLWAPSRFWSKMPIGLLYFWAQTRKRKLDVWWTSQSERRVDTVIKEVTNYIYTTRNLPFFFIVKKYLPEDIRSERKKLPALGISFERKQSKIYRLFDTFEMIELEQFYTDLVIKDGGVKKGAREEAESARELVKECDSVIAENVELHEKRVDKKRIRSLKSIIRKKSWEGIGFLDQETEKRYRETLGLKADNQGGNGERTKQSWW